MRPAMSATQMTFFFESYLRPAISQSLLCRSPLSRYLVRTNAFSQSLSKDLAPEFLLSSRCLTDKRLLVEGVT